MTCKKWFAVFVLLVTTCVIQGCASSPVPVAGSHAGHQPPASAGGTPAECLDPVAPPALRCSKVVSATFDNHGRLWLAWVMGNHVYVNYSDDYGRLLSEPVRVNAVAQTIGAHGEYRPKLVVTDNGYVYVAYTQMLPEKRFSGHIRFSRSLDDGKSFSEPIIVNSDQQVTSHRFESLAVNPEGRIYLAWLDKRDLEEAKRQGAPYRGAALYYARSDDGGATFKDAKIADHSCECCRTAMTIEDTGLPVIVWRHIYDTNTRDHALVRFAGIDTPGAPVRLSHDNWQVDACPHHGPALSIAADGVYHTVWFNNAPARHGLFYAYSTDRGRIFSGPVAFGNYDAQAGHPDVLSLGLRVFVAWKEFNGQTSDIYLMESFDQGRNWSSPRRLAQTQGAGDYPFLLTDGQRVYVSWQTDREGFQMLGVASLEPAAREHKH